MLSTAASQQEGPRFESGSGRFYVEFTCSPCVCVGFIREHWFPPTSQKHANWGCLISHSKLPIGMSVLDNTDTQID